MSDKNDFYMPEEDLQLDELLADARQQMDSAPGEAFAQSLPDDELPQNDGVFPREEMPQPDASFGSASPLPPEQEPEFVPDFGDAFDDYGEYDEYDASQPPLGDYLPDGEENEEEDSLPEKPKRKKKRRIVPLPVKILLYIVLVGVAAVGLGYGLWECAQDVMAFGRSDEMLTVVVSQGDTLDDIAQKLKEKGVIKYPWLFKVYCKLTDSTQDMDPGTYELYYNYDYHALVKGMMATSPNRTTVRVTIPEGMTAAQIFALMEKNGVCSAAELEACAAETEFDYWFLEGIPYGEATRLEGFLFPDTYDFYESDDPERVLDKLLTNFNRKFSDNARAQIDELNLTLAEKLRSNGFDEDYIAGHQLTVYEVMIVASMVEREAAGASESATIASVIYNRLCDPTNFPYLQIDATVVYALGGISGSLTEDDLKVDSPYNTYNHSGLPVGPISNPGLSSISAALNPSDTEYYFYALDNSTGSHHFSKTYDEHNAFLGEQNNGE